MNPKETLASRANAASEEYDSRLLRRRQPERLDHLLKTGFIAQTSNQVLALFGYGPREPSHNKSF